MSTLKTINVQHPSSSTVNVTLDNSGNATVGNNVTITGTASVGGNLSFNSGYGSAAVAYGCRAWVNFNGTGTVAIRGSGNVSSITDNGVGSYTINFSTAMPNANYAVTALAGNETALTGIYIAAGGETSATPTASAYLLRTINDNAYADLSHVYVAIFR